MSCFEPALLMNIHLVNVCVCGRIWSEAHFHQNQSKVTEEQLTLTNSNSFGSFQMDLERTNFHLWSAHNQGTTPTPSPNFSYRKGWEKFLVNSLYPKMTIFLFPVCLLYQFGMRVKPESPNLLNLEPFDKTWMSPCALCPHRVSAKILEQGVTSTRSQISVYNKHINKWATSGHIQV